MPGIALRLPNTEFITLNPDLSHFTNFSNLPSCLPAVFAYDSDKLDSELRRYGIELIAPHRMNRQNTTQDLRRALRRQACPDQRRLALLLEGIVGDKLVPTGIVARHDQYDGSRTR